jgi:O-antigen/teichoic acid export membrane protein
VSPRLRRRLASNLAILGVAEITCRAMSVLATLALAKRLGPPGLGRIMFAFNIVFWLVLVVRDCFETIATREIARHPGITRTLVNHVLAAKLALAVLLYGALVGVGLATYSDPVDRWILALYGVLLLTTALGLDFVFRGKETVGLVAVSLGLRTLVYCAGVWFTVPDASRIAFVPLWLAVGEFTGIALVWAAYAREFGFPRPAFGLRSLVVLFKRGQSVCLIHLCQAVIVSVDLAVVGVMSPWGTVGHYAAPQTIIAAATAFGVILQQVVLPSLSRSGHASERAGRGILEFAVGALLAAFLPIAMGGTVLAEPLMRFLFPAEFDRSSALLLALGIWRAPLLSLAFLYQTTLIALNRESEGVRLLVWGAAGSVPLLALTRWWFGLPGASIGVLLIALALVAAGYALLAESGCHPSVGRHLARPLLASAAMIPPCLAAMRIHLALAVLAGATVYLITLACLGGLDFTGSGRNGPRLSE